MIAGYVKILLPLKYQQVTYIGELPTDIDTCIALKEIGGGHGTYFAKDQMDTPYLQVYVRCPSYTEGYEMIKQCKNIITSYADAQLLSVVLAKDINYYGRDDKRRNLFSITFKIYSYLNLK